MVGNDIVDLRDPQSRSESLHPRFDTRVFSERERRIIGEAADSERVRWKLWAAKEAAYKLMRKMAMDKNMRIADVAKQILDISSLLQ